MMLSLEGVYDSQITSAIPTYCPSCPPALVLSLVQAESSGNQFTNAGGLVTSSQGAIGLFQLEPATAAGLNVNPATPAGNIQGGLTYLQQLYNQFGNWPDALAAYNEGPGALQTQLNAGVTPTSAGYASGILANAGMSDSSPSDTSDDSGDDSDGDDSSSTILGLSTGVWWAIAGITGILALSEL
jgi:hypothetical protein